MRQPGWNAIDRRRGQLLPRDYLIEPHRFGRRGAQFRLPEGGLEADLRVAMLQHTLAERWLAGGRQPSSGQIRERWGISKQVWSRTVRGERWAGETVLAALATEVGGDRDHYRWPVL